MSKIYPVGRVYAIRSPNTDDIYVGSTFSPLCKRIAGHKSDHKKFLDGKGKNITSFKILEAGDAYIELLEQYEDCSKEQLNRYEGEYIRKTKCVNRCIAGRTDKEYRVDNAKLIKEYREKNIEKNIKYQKKYRTENVDTVAKSKKEYRAKNKEIINEKQSVKHDCICGKSYTQSHKKRHEASAKHLAFRA